MTTLQQSYTNQIRETLKNDLKITNLYAVPKLQKVLINVGWGELKGNEGLQKDISNGLSLITGQKPVVTRAKKAIAGFKLRQGDIVGYRITLRSHRMYEFLDRLITYVLPRLRDFQGINRLGFDGHGNFSFGLREQTVFPEIPYQSNDKVWGMQITIVTTAETDDQARALLAQFGFPFTKEKEKS
jgi:large subunit ribosomal protein L5